MSFIKYIEFIMESHECTANRDHKPFIGHFSFQFPLSFNHLLAAPELTREQSAIFRIKGEKIQIF